MSDTPRTDDLYKNPFDSNDVRAWQNLASDLESELTQLQSTLNDKQKTLDIVNNSLADCTQRFIKANQEIEQQQETIDSLKEALEFYHSALNKLVTGIDANGNFHMNKVLLASLCDDSGRVARQALEKVK